jgi:hypothetical protein
MSYKRCGLVGLVLLLIVPSVAMGGPAESAEDSDLHWLWLPNALLASANIISSVFGDGEVALGAIGLASGTISIVDGWRVSDRDLFLTGILAASSGVVSLVLWRRDRRKPSSNDQGVVPIIRWVDGGPELGATLSF